MDEPASINECQHEFRRVEMFQCKECGNLTYPVLRADQPVELPVLKKLNNALDKAIQPLLKNPQHNSTEGLIYHYLVEALNCAHLIELHPVGVDIEAGARAIANRQKRREPVEPDRLDAFACAEIWGLLCK